MKQKIALCQLLPEANNSQKNFVVIENAVKDSASKGIRLCVFPEDFLYGVLRDGQELFNASKKSSEWLERFRDLAKKYKIDIIPGSFPTFKQEKIFNSTVYISSKGEILNNYSKTNLWLSERKKYAPSVISPKSFSSILGKTVLLICWGIFDHKLFEAAVRQGAEWVIVIAFWSINQSQDALEERGLVQNKYSRIFDTHMIDSLVQARVMEFNIGVIFCNFGGTHVYIGNNKGKQKAISANRTQIATPFNSVYKRLANSKERMLVLEVPSITQQIKDFESYYGRREDVVQGYPYAR